MCSASSTLSPNSIRKFSIWRASFKSTRPSAYTCWHSILNFTTRSWCNSSVVLLRSIFVMLLVVTLWESICTPPEMALASPICRVADCFSVVSCGSCAPQYGQHGKAQPSGNPVLHLVQIFILCYVLEFHFLYNPSEVVSAVFKNIFLLNALSHFEKALRRILSIFEIFRNFRYLQIYSFVNSFVFIKLAFCLFVHKA